MNAMRIDWHTAGVARSRGIPSSGQSRLPCRQIGLISSQGHVAKPGSRVSASRSALVPERPAPMMTTGVKGNASLP
jgi:hypothetical protein